MSVRLLPLLLLIACARGADEPAPSEPSKAEPAPAELVPKLALLDAADGAVDQRVSSCALCSMSMAGSEEWSTQYADYEFLLCGESCRDLFASDPAHWVNWVELPVR